MSRNFSRAFPAPAITDVRTDFSPVLAFRAFVLGTVCAKFPYSGNLARPSLEALSDFLLSSALGGKFRALLFQPKLLYCQSVGEKPVGRRKTEVVFRKRAHVNARSCVAERLFVCISSCSI